MGLRRDWDLGEGEEFWIRLMRVLLRVLLRVRFLGMIWAGIGAFLLEDLRESRKTSLSRKGFESKVIVVVGVFRIDRKITITR